uniref:hypothetical protein n=1 Tax=Nocardioides sp. 616 TaxID=2268090 RepID=UPI00196656D5
FNAADLVASMAPMVTAADFMPKFNAASLSAAMARSITSNFLKVGVRYSLEDGVTAMARRASVLDVEELHRLVGAARDAAPKAVPTDEVIQAVVLKAVYAVPLPVDEQGLLVDDAALVSSWVAALVERALAAAGLSERDLKEDAVAGYVYLLVGSIVFALLLNLPVFAGLGGMLGIAAHPPAKVAAKVSRTVYRRLNG